MLRITAALTLGGYRWIVSSYFYPRTKLSISSSLVRPFEQTFSLIRAVLRYFQIFNLIDILFLLFLISCGGKNVCGSTPITWDPHFIVFLMSPSYAGVPFQYSTCKVIDLVLTIIYKMH